MALQHVEWQTSDLIEMDLRVKIEQKAEQPEISPTSFERRMCLMANIRITETLHQTQNGA